MKTMGALKIQSLALNQPGRALRVQLPSTLRQKPAVQSRWGPSRSTETNLEFRASKSNANFSASTSNKRSRRSTVISASSSKLGSEPEAPLQERVSNYFDLNCVD